MSDELVFGCSIIDPRAVTDPEELAEEYERDWREMSFLERRAARYDNDQNYREDE